MSGKYKLENTVVLFAAHLGFCFYTKNKKIKKENNKLKNNNLAQPDCYFVTHRPPQRAHKKKVIHRGGFAENPKISYSRNTTFEAKRALRR